MTAYYNEFDPKAAAWIRELIKAGLIAPGVVDERSIEDVTPNDLAGFTQCHFFAGIGVWSYALRKAGWSDSRRVWTMSCPCQPFSAAGKGDGFDDERHLWPAGQYLISQCKPDVVFGEQVASKDADTWIDLVHTDMEALGYAFGAVPFPSASVGAPHIRDRLYWVADSELSERGQSDQRIAVTDGQAYGRNEGTNWPGERGTVGMVGQPDSTGRLAGREGSEAARYGSAVESAGSVGGVADSTGGGRQQQSNARSAKLFDSKIATEKQMQQSGTDGTSVSGMADAGSGGSETRLSEQEQWEEGGAGEYDNSGDQPIGRETPLATAHPSPTNGFWRDADWLGCRDGKWRPVESGTFPLAHGAAARVGRLRGFGNAINAEAAKAFIESYLGV